MLGPWGSSKRASSKDLKKVVENKPEKQPKPKKQTATKKQPDTKKETVNFNFTVFKKLTPKQKIQELKNYLQNNADAYNDLAKNETIVRENIVNEENFLNNLVVDYGKSDPLTKKQQKKVKALNSKYNQIKKELNFS